MGTAQVMTRMHLNWKADEDTEGATKTTFQKVSIIVGIYWFVHFFVGPTEEDVDSLGTIVALSPPSLILTMQAVSFLFFIYTMYIITKTRKAVREKYDIPETYCPGGCEDCCCAFWCGNCVSAQMARHTADYDNDAAFYCTSTGIPKKYPVMIV